MNMKRLFLLLIICYFSIGVFSQEPLKYVEDFFITYDEKGAISALDKIFQTNSWMMERSKDKIENVKNQLGNLVSIIGDYHGYEFICIRSIGKSIVQYSYLVKYDRQPLRFSFTFYKAKDVWQLYNFEYDDRLIEELDESSKVYRLKENFDF